MFKKIFLFLIFGSLSFCYIPHLQNQNLHDQYGLFMPQITPYSATTFDGVIYNKFCKALCCLYVPVEPVCGTNNVVYENACMAKCDRVGVDKTRIRFNNKCCCQAGSDVVQDDINLSLTLIDDEDNIKFAIPQCIGQCLGIASISDLTISSDIGTDIDGTLVP